MSTFRERNQKRKETARTGGISSPSVSSKNGTFSDRFQERKNKMMQGTKSTREPDALAKFATKTLTEREGYKPLESANKAISDVYAKQAELMNMDIDASKAKADEYEAALPKLRKYQGDRANILTTIRQVESDLQYKKDAGWDVTHDEGVLKDLQSQLATIDAETKEYASQYGFEGLRDMETGISNLRKDIRTAYTVQTNKKLTEKAMNSPEFETKNAYGKTTEAGVEKVKAFLYLFPELTLNNAITDPKHEMYGGGTVLEPGHDFYEAMSEDEKKVLGYYLENGETGEAREYLESIQESVGAKVAAMYAKESDNWFDELMFSVASGKDQFASGLKGVGNAIAGKEGYVYSTPVQQGSALIRKNISERDGIGNRILGGAYDLTQTTVNMLPSVLVGMVNPTAGAVVMGASAAGNAYNEMINLGYSKNQARAYGLMVGASETLLERFLGGVTALRGTSVAAKLASKIDNAFGRAAITIGADALSEFTEETLQTYLEPWFKSIVTDLDYEAPGIDEALYAGLLGALSAGMFNGGTLATNAAVNKIHQVEAETNFGETLLKTENANASIKNLIDNAQNSGNKKLERTANKVAKTEKDGAYDVSARKVGKLTRLSSEQLAKSIEDTATGKDLKSQTIEKLTKSGMNQKGAERAFDLISRDAARGSESKELLSLIDKNPDIRTMYDNMANYLSEEAVTKRVEEKVKASPVTEIEQSLTEQRLKDAGIEVVDEATVEKDDIVDVDHVDEDGVAYVKTESGKVIPYKSDSLSISSASHKKMGYASLFGTNGAKTYFALAPETESSRYMNDFTNLYNDGLKGRNFALIESSIPEDIQRAIYNAGKSDLKNAAEKSKREYEKAKQKEAAFVKKQMGFKSDRVTLSEEAVAKIKSVSDKGISDQYKAAVKVIDGLAKMLQVNINIVASETDADGNYIGAKGMYNRATNTFTFDIMSGMDNVADISYSAIIKTAGHELTHFIQNWSPSKYLTLKNTTLKFLKDQNDAAWITERLDEIRSDNEAIGKKLTLEQAKDELVADAFEDVLLNIDFAETILRTDKTLFDKIHSWVKKNVNEFKKNLGIAVKDVEANSEAAKEMRNAGERAQALYDQWTDAFSTALENSTSGQTDVDADVQLQARSVNGKNVAWIKENILLERGEQSVHTFIEEYIKKHIGEYYTIFESGQKVYLGEDLPYEYVHSKYTDNIRNTAKGKAKNRAAADLGAMIEIATNRKWEKTKNTETKDAKYGFYKYDTNFAFPVFVGEKLTSVKAYSASLLIRNASDGKKYLYDVINIKKDDAIGVELFEKESRSLKRAHLTSSLSNITQDNDIVKKNLPEDTQAQARKKTRFDVNTRLDLIETAKKNKMASDAASKGLILEYQRNLRSYQAAETTWRIARYHKDTDAIVAAATAMQLRRNTIASIECTKVFAELFGKLDIPYLVEETSAENGLSQIALQNAKEAVRRARQALSEAERDAIEWARRIDVAGQRVYDASMRRMRLENSQALNSVQNRIKQAMDKPNTRSSIPVGGKPLAEAIMRTAKELNKLMSSKSTFSPEAETIALIKEAAVIGAGGDVRAQSINRQDSINIVDKFGSQFKAEFKALSELYGNIKENKNLSFMYDEEIHANLDQYSADKPDYDDVWSYIFDCARLVRAVAYDLTNANTIMVNKRAESYLELRGGLEYDFMHYAPKKMRKALANAASSITLTPEVFLHAIFGHTENANKVYQIYDDGQNKYIDVVLAARGLFAEIEEQTDKNGKKLYGEANKKKLLSNEATIDLHMYDGDGNKVLTNEDHAISFILAAKNADYRRHIMYGGWAIPDLEKANKGKNAYLDGRTTEHILDGENDNGEIIEYVTVERGGKQIQIPRIDFTMIDNMRAEANRFQAIGEIDKAIDLRCKLALANQEIKKIESDWEKKILEAAGLAERHLSSYAKACMQKLDTFYNNVAKTFLDEATEERYGFKKTLEKNHYYPIQVVKEQATQAELNTLVKQDYRVSALGSMKRRVRSRISCKLYGAVSSFAYNVENTAKYYGYLNTLNYIKKITGVSYDKMTDEKGKKKQTKEDIVTLGSYINRNLGNTVFTDYLYTLESDISGGKGMTTAADKALDFIYSGFVANALFFNISPTAKQISALPLVYPDAGLSASIRGIIKGATTKGDAKGKTKLPMGLNEAQKRYVARYSRIYKYRSGGLVDADISDFKQSNHPIARVMSKHPTLTGVNWMERTDSQVLGLQFYAILESVKKSNPNLSAQEAATKAGEILDKTIQHFQANSTVLQRAPLLRSKGSTGMSLARVTVGTFKSQQLTMLNAKIDSLLKVATLENQIKELEKSNKREDAEKLKSLKSELSRSKKYAARVAAAIMVSHIINAAFTVAIQLLYKRTDDEDELWKIYGWDLLQSYMSLVPGVGDAVYYLTEQLTDNGYYGDGFAEVGLLGVINDFIDVIGSIGDGEYTVDRVAKDIGKLVAPFGVAARNMWNIVKAIFKWIGVEIE